MIDDSDKTAGKGQLENDSLANQLKESAKSSAKHVEEDVIVPESNNSGSLLRYITYFLIFIVIAEVIWLLTKHFKR